jgi:hypothetical protein
VWGRRDVQEVARVVDSELFRPSQARRPESVAKSGRNTIRLTRGTTWERMSEPAKFKHRKAFVSQSLALHLSFLSSRTFNHPRQPSSTSSMGLLYLGTPYPWSDAKRFAEHVRHHGISQFLHIWDRLKDRYGDELLWGDEVRLIYILL